MKNRRAKVVYSYVPQNEDELKLDVDDMIEVLEEIEEGWWKGTSRSGSTGVFPSNFVVVVSNDSTVKNDLSDNELSGDSVDGNVHSNKSSALTRDDSTEKKPKPVKGIGLGDIFAGGIKPKLSPIDSSIDKMKGLPKKPPPPTPASDSDSAPKLPPKPVREQAKVLFAYEAQNDDELTIKEGEIINIISKEIEDVGWWKGELNGRIALFPDNFVEIIKCAEETNSMPRVKKPERPTEKPPPPVSQSKSNSNTTKSESNKSSNKPIDDLPKTSTGSKSIGLSSAPVIPGKKPKILNSGSILQKPKSEQNQTLISVKPDVVPQENGSKLERDLNTSSNSNSDNQFNSIDPSGNKLTHLTAQRPKGPSSRRPPSTIFIPKESGTETKENGDISLPNKNEVNVINVSEPIKVSTVVPEKVEKVEKLPPWMLELRKAQEKRKENPEESPKELNKPQLSSPIKSAPNRFSGDFGNKSNEDSEPTTPIQLLKSLKPIASVSVVTTAESVSTSSVIQANNICNITSKTTNVVINSNTTTATTTPITSSISSIKVSKVDDNVGNSIDKKELSELEKELKALKESTVSRKDFEDLVKQVTELREIVETQKQSYSKVIKDLINDVADERKKLATLQIEIDRLRKLTTTV